MGGGGGGGAMRPPFVRSPPPEGPLHEEHELIWDDGVAPEVCLDFDAPYIAKSLGLKMWLGGFAFFTAVFSFASLQPYDTNPAVRDKTPKTPPPPRKNSTAAGSKEIPPCSTPRAHPPAHPHSTPRA